MTHSQQPIGIYNGYTVEILGTYTDSGDYIVANIYSPRVKFPNGKRHAIALLSEITDIQLGNCYCSDDYSFICENCELKWQLDKLKDEPIPF